MTSVRGTPARATRAGGGVDEGMPYFRGVVLHAHGQRGDVVLAALRAARNVRTELADAPLEIVVQGGAVGHVVTEYDVTAEVLRAISEETAEVALCRNSLVGAGLVDTDVPAGGFLRPGHRCPRGATSVAELAYARL